MDGKFKIARHNGWELTFSSVGFQPQTIKVGPKTPSHLKIVLKEDAHNLGEVVIKQKREHYSRKNNPAVELMKRVIAAKKRSLIVEKVSALAEKKGVTVQICDISVRKI